MKVSPLCVTNSSVFTIICVLHAQNVSSFSSDKETPDCLPKDLECKQLEASVPPIMEEYNDIQPCTSQVMTTVGVL